MGLQKVKDEVGGEGLLGAGEGWSLGWQRGVAVWEGADSGREGWSGFGVLGISCFL